MLPIEGCAASLAQGKIVGRSWHTASVRTSRLAAQITTVNSVLVQEPGLTAAERDGRVVVLEPASRPPHFDFNKVASEIWGLLSSAHRVEMYILQKLSQHHDVGIEIMTSDVMSFLQSLVTERLVRIVAVEDAR